VGKDAGCVIFSLIESLKLSGGSSLKNLSENEGKSGTLEYISVNYYL
jgi:hypothetical protein